MSKWKGNPMTNTNNTNELKKYEITYAYINDEDGIIEEQCDLVAKFFAEDDGDADAIFYDTYDVGKSGEVA